MGLVEKAAELVGGSVGAAVSKVVDSIAGVADRFIRTDDERAQFKEALTPVVLAHITAMQKAASNTIIAEATGRSWLQRNWRPLLMIEFGVIIAWNYMVIPIARVLYPQLPAMEIPPDMWALIKIGVGGYVVGRSGEKIVSVLWEGKSK